MASEVLAVIIGNRDFFPDALVAEARNDIIKLFNELGVEAVMLSQEESKLGAVETWQDARRCGELLKKREDDIAGILVCLPNFGDEKAIADSIRISGLKVPVLVQASPDDLDQFGLDRRRDAFCGKISVCNNLRQYGFRYTLTHDHTVSVLSGAFRRDILNFLAICRVYRGLRQLRIGAVGARPNAFNTTRYSEKLLEQAGISVNTIDLSEIFARAGVLSNVDSRVLQIVEKIKNYAEASAVPAESLLRMARFAAGSDTDKCVFFHCGNWAKEFLPDIRIGTAPILGTILGEENTVGALAGRTPQGPLTYGRISTDDAAGAIRAFVGEGVFTDDPLNTFGTRAVVKIPQLRALLHHICKEGFEHHAAMSPSHCAGPVAEAMSNYLSWNVYYHSA